MKCKVCVFVGDAADRCSVCGEAQEEEKLPWYEVLPWPLDDETDPDLPRDPNEPRELARRMMHEPLTIRRWPRSGTC